MGHDENVYDSLKHYFSVLELTGNYPNNEVIGLLIYCFIVDQVFDGPLSEYLDDAGLAAFNKTLSCLYSKGCLINNPDTLVISAPRGQRHRASLRISEAEAQRLAENNDLLRII